MNLFPVEASIKHSLLSVDIPPAWKRLQLFHLFSILNSPKGLERLSFNSPCFIFFHWSHTCAPRLLKEQDMTITVPSKGLFFSWIPTKNITGPKRHLCYCKKLCFQVNVWLLLRNRILYCSWPGTEFHQGLIRDSSLLGYCLLNGEQNIPDYHV